MRGLHPTAWSGPDPAPGLECTRTFRCRPPPNPIPTCPDEAQVNSLSLFEIGAVPASELCRAWDRVPDPIVHSPEWQPLWGPRPMVRLLRGRLRSSLLLRLL